MPSLAFGVRWSASILDRYRPSTFNGKHGTSFCISTRPISIKVSRSSGLIGDNFVRLALISRSIQRRCIAFARMGHSRDFPAHNLHAAFQNRPLTISFWPPASSGHSGHSGRPARHPSRLFSNFKAGPCSYYANLSAPACVNDK